MNDDPRVLNFGRRVKRLRRAKELSQESLADTASINASHLSAIERGTKIPTLTTVYRLADALKVTAGELVDGASFSRRDDPD